jgi:TatD DNase family protein
MLVDTHCHIHEASYALPVDRVLQRAEEANVATMLCVGTSIASSQEAIAFAEQTPHCYASIGVHPHDTKEGYDISALASQSSKIVAVGEIGLDYFYGHSPKEVQIEALKAQIEIALKHDLPIIFHVRDAFDDFWPIFDSYQGIRGVLHSFTDTLSNMQKAIDRGLYIGVNGISTFTKDTVQQAMFDAIPLNRLLFETDAPFLTPVPFRGKVNEPALVSAVAQYHAKRKDISLEEIALATTTNAHALFAL